MKHLFILIMGLVSLFPGVFAQNTKDAFAKTPPMGWNSFNCFGSAVHENEVRANADYMAKNLKQFGWQYVVIDFLWSYDNPPGSKLGGPEQKNLEDGSYIPWLAMDEWGRLLPNVNKFPSAFGSNGFKTLADYIHSQGLKFGIHVMRGIPRQAVWAKSPVLGTNGITADMIADTSSVCPWMNHMYGLSMKKPGAQEYLNSLLKLYASWGVDFIKVDDLSRPYSNSEIEGYSQAILNCGRPVVMSLSPGETPIAQSAHAVQYSNMWRMSDDFWDNWKRIIEIMDLAKKWQGTGGPGHWPDCDMLQIGKLSKRGPMGPERFCHFTDDELYTHITFWCLYRSPLMIGGNMPENREIETKLLTNEEVIAVNQKGKNPKELYNKDNMRVWVSQMEGPAVWNAGLFNLDDHPKEITVKFSDLGLKGQQSVRDLWQKKDLGTYKNEFRQMVPAHGSLLIRIGKPS